MFADITAPVVLTFQLLRRFWPQLVALVLVGILANDLLMLLAAKVGLANHMAGLALLTLVAFAQLGGFSALRRTSRLKNLQNCRTLRRLTPS